MDKKFVTQVAESIITSLFTDGLLTPDDLTLSREDFSNKIMTIVGSSELSVTVDHRDKILIEADTFFKRKEYELSKIMYAMFFEHSLNGLISNYCSRKRFDEKTKVDIIRSVDLQGKLSWLLKILGFPIFNDAHRKIIKKLSDERNSFIHYKWKPEASELKTPLTNDIIEEFKSIKKATIYMKKYEAKILFNNKKKHLVTKLKRK